MSGTPSPAEDIFAANRALGRIALAVKTNGATTRRLGVREEGPLRVRCPGPPSAELEAVILNTAGGVAGGDRFKIDVCVAPQARLLVTTAAAEKIYRSLGSAAQIDINLEVDCGGALAWLPQETILFDGAQLTRTIQIDLARDARIIFAEAIIFGRLGMGETVRRGGLLDRWRIQCQGRLVHAEAMRFEGEIASKLARAAVTKGNFAIATLLVMPADESSVSVVRAIRYFGEVAASAWKGLMMVRLCAADGATLRHDLVALLHAVRGGSLPRLWVN